MVGKVEVVRIFVAQAHPVEESYNGAILEAVVGALQASGSVVDVCLLGDGTNDGPEHLDGYDSLVLISPIWWGGLPAHLQSWIQRILSPCIDQPGSTAHTSPLSSIAHLVAVVTHGSSLFINRIEGEPAKQLLAKTVLPLCADGASFDWVSLYKLDRCSPHELENFIEGAATSVAKITTGRSGD